MDNQKTSCGQAACRVLSLTTGRGVRCMQTIRQRQTGWLMGAWMGGWMDEQTDTLPSGLAYLW